MSQYYMTGEFDHSNPASMPHTSRPSGFRTSSRRQPTQQIPSTPEYESYAEDMRCRSATVATVNAWISNVQPGSPAPISPPKDSFTGYPYHRSGHRDTSPPGSDSRSSASSSSHSLSHHALPVKADSIPTAGYAPIVVAFPNGAPPVTHSAVEVPRESRRHRSVSLKPAKKGTVDAPEPRTPKEKKEKKHKQMDEEAFIAQQLALSQLFGGGTLEHHAKQFAKARAKSSGAKKGDQGAYDLYRDERGRLWIDQEAEVENARLLGDNRRPSASSQDSDLGDVPRRRGREHHRPPPLNLVPSVPVDVPTEPKKVGKLKGLFSAVTGKKSTRA